MRKFLVLFFCILISVSCSSTQMSKNSIHRSNVYISGGIEGSKIWKDQLKGERVSWMQEMTLVFDLYIYPIGNKSSFYSWLEKNERDVVDSVLCENPTVVFIYNLDDKKIRKRDFLLELKKKDIELNSAQGFVKNFQMHPEYLENSLHLYDGYLTCLANSLSVALPGYREIRIY